MKFAPVALNMLGLKINSVDNGASVNLGPSVYLEIFVSYKRNQGIGEQNGDFSPTLMTQSTVSDMDFIDSPAVKSSFL